MISANEIGTLLSEEYDDNPRWSLSSYDRRDGNEDWEPVDEDGEDLEYYVTEEEHHVRIDNVGTFEFVANGGINHDGGEIYQVIKFTDLEGNSQNFVRFGWYSSWDSNQWESDWQKGEPFEYTETRWREKVAERLEKVSGGAAGHIIANLNGIADLRSRTITAKDIALEVIKRIGELRAVHFWLDQNSKALGATIQALEVQKMTLATLKGMNFNMGEVAKALKLKPADSFFGAGSKPQTGPSDAVPKREAPAAEKPKPARKAGMISFSRRSATLATL